MLGTRRSREGEAYKAQGAVVVGSPALQVGYGGGCAQGPGVQAENPWEKGRTKVTRQYKVQQVRQCCMGGIRRAVRLEPRQRGNMRVGKPGITKAARQQTNAQQGAAAGKNQSAKRQYTQNGQVGRSPHGYAEQNWVIGGNTRQSREGSIKVKTWE